MNSHAPLLTLSGNVAPHGSHLHLSLATPDGRVIGGHAACGCTVRTTAEVVLALLPQHRFTRLPDARTRYDELLVERAASPPHGPGG